MDTDGSAPTMRPRAAPMEFKITHITTYRYGLAAAEAYGEARLTPPDLPTQKVVRHRVTIDPPTPTSTYKDHYGNTVAFFSLLKPRRRKPTMLRPASTARLPSAMP